MSLSGCARSWTGFPDPGARRRRWEEDGWIGRDSAHLAVSLADGTLAGLVSWRNIKAGGPTTLANRLQAITDVENLAEQRVLERIGFRREGVMRGLAFIGERWRDGVLYARLREDPA